MLLILGMKIILFRVGSNCEVGFGCEDLTLQGGVPEEHHLPRTIF